MVLHPGVCVFFPLYWGYLNIKIIKNVKSLKYVLGKRVMGFFLLLLQVSEVSSRLSRAGTVGLGKAVEVLDTLGSSMANLNSGNGFASAAPTKGNEIAILAFEIANTIVKGSNLVQSLSKRNIRQLKEEVLPSKGVQHLISQDTEELLRIFASDKRWILKNVTSLSVEQALKVYKSFFTLKIYKI